jgi:hypothetical protein
MRNTRIYSFIKHERFNSSCPLSRVGSGIAIWGVMKFTYDLGFLGAITETSDGEIVA